MKRTILVCDGPTCSRDLDADQSVYHWWHLENIGPLHRSRTGPGYPDSADFCSYGCLIRWAAERDTRETGSTVRLDRLNGAHEVAPNGDHPTVRLTDPPPPLRPWHRSQP